MAQDHGMIGARICSTWGCGRAVHSIGRSTCCSACSVGRHTRRCQRNVKEALRMSITECTTEGCVLPVGYGHTSCCSTCRRSWGRLHTDRCHCRLPQRQEDSLQLGPVVPRLIGGRQLSWYRRRLAHRLAELTQATERQMARHPSHPGRSRAVLWWRAST